VFIFGGRHEAASSLLALLCVGTITASTEGRISIQLVAATLVRLNDNGAWSWFMDPRVIVNDGKLIVGSVRAIGSNQANVTDPRWGNVEISVYDRNCQSREHRPSSASRQDDHDGPAFRPQGRPLPGRLQQHNAKRRECY
jgi:hypothetical protein